MRWVWILGLSLVAGRAEAKPPPPVPAEDPDLGDLWREMIEPHRAVVTAIVARARGILGELGEVTAAGDAPVDQRVRYASHAHGMLRYALRLSPENPEVLSLPGTADDELGK
jgi:hypothetical protein